MVRINKGLKLFAKQTSRRYAEARVKSRYYDLQMHFTWTGFCAIFLKYANDSFVVGGLGLFTKSSAVVEPLYFFNYYYEVSSTFSNILIK